MILIHGSISYDVILPLKDLPGPHEKVICQGAVTGFGGSAANTAWWLGKMGIPVRLSGAAGKDLFGEAHLASLAEAGVQVSGVDRVEEGSGMAVVFSLNREKRIIRVPGANVFGRFNPGLMDGCRLVYLSGINVPVRRQIAAQARSRGIPVVCGWHGAQDPGLAALVDGFIMNADEGERLTGRTDPGEIIRALGASFAAIMVWKGSQMAYMAFQYDDRMSTPLGTPLGIPYSFIPIGFGILFLHYFVTLIIGRKQAEMEPGTQEV